MSGYSKDDLVYDEAFFAASVTSNGVQEVFLYQRNENCDGCPFLKAESNPVNGTAVFSKRHTHYPWYFRLRSSGDQEMVLQSEVDSYELCTEKVSMGQHGVYQLSYDPSTEKCSLKVLEEPDNADLPVLYCFLILLGLGILYRVTTILYNKGFFDCVVDPLKKFYKLMGFQLDDETGNNNEEDEKTAKQKKRIRSLDTFRGIAIALMIFVNDGAGGYYFFEHATWNGLYVADLAFPWFVWIMGFCVPMGLRSVLKNKTPFCVAIWRILWRSFKLFMLGFFWGNAGWINLAKVRVPGVLQRLGIAYLFTATFSFIPAFISDNSEKNSNIKGKMRHLIDLTTHWGRWIFCIICVIAHTVITFCLPVPNCPTGYLGPAGLHDDAKYPKECVGGAAGYIDKQVMGIHIYQNPTAKAVYQTGAFDPEGILGCLTTIFQTYLGYQAGQIILSFSGHRQRIVRFVIWGVVCGLIGLTLCQARLNDGWIPINKNLWSLSYVFVTSGLAFLLMAMVYFVVDVKEWWAGEPFFYAGMNSIVLYLGHSSAWQMLPFNFAAGNVIEGTFSMASHFANLAESLWGVGLWMYVSYVLFVNKLFVVV